MKIDDLTNQPRCATGKPGRWTYAKVAALLLGWFLPACSVAGPSLPEPALEEASPVVCKANEDIVIVGRFIRTRGDGIRTQGNCNVRIVDSHIVAEGIAVHISSNSDVEIVRSFVQGRQASVAVRGNADVRLSSSTLRGPVQQEGLGEMVDLEDNQFERLPSALSQSLRDSAPLRCGSGERLTWEGLSIAADRVGVVVEDGCELLLTDSIVQAQETAIEVHPGGSVRIRNATVESPVEALRVASGGVAHLAGASFAGDLAGSGSILDGGGNAFSSQGLPRREAHSEGSRDHGTTRGGSIQIGRRGVEIRRDHSADGGRIKIGAGGIDIRGSRAVGDRPVGSCADLCRLWPAISAQQAVCVSSVVDSLGFPVGETAACVDVESQGGCLACSATLDLPDRVCRAAAERCL